MSDLCSHQQDYPEGAELPADVSLDHFLHCYTQDEQLEAWKSIRATVDAGRRCWEADHYRLQMLTDRRNELLTGIREVIQYLESGRRDPRALLTAAEKLQGLIS